MRYRLCKVKKGEEEKTAYLPEKDSILGKIVNEWEVIEVSVMSITEETLKSLKVVKKEKY